MPRDYYETLGVAKNADSETIKKAYRKLAMQFHPDRNPGNKEAEEKFKEAAEAYDVLGNAEKRSRYDQFGHAAFKGGQGGFGGGGFHDVNDIFSAFSDIFSDFFGDMGGGPAGRARRNGPARGAHLRYMLDVTLKEVVEGTEKNISFGTEATCDGCQGSRSEQGSSPVTCPDCKGRGQIVRAQGFFSVATTCPTCRGDGEVVKNPCKKCRGSGRTEIQKNLKVKVPPGVDNGTQLRLAGEGEAGYRGGPGGDLFVEIRIKEDKRFAREGEDLYGVVEVSYLQALLGADIEVETIKGTSTLEVPAGTQPGDEISIKGAGIPALRGYGRGDLIFRVQVNIPKKLEKNEEQMLRDIAKTKGEAVKGIAGLFGKNTKKGRGAFFGH